MGKKGKGKKVEKLEEMLMVIGLPVGTFKAEISCEVMGADGETFKCGKVLTARDIQELREDFVENVGDDYNAKYVLTDKGRACLEELNKEMGN